MGRRVYLVVSMLLFGLLFVSVVYPYISAYASFSRGLKDLSSGAVIVYDGLLDYAIFDSDVSEYMYRFEIIVKYSNNISLVLKIYDFNKTSLLFEGEADARQGGSMLEFLFPRGPYTVIGGPYYDLRLEICGERDRIYFGPMGMPSYLGVPVTFPALLEAGGFRLANVDWEEGCRPLGSGFGEGFYEYFRISSGYMLLVYSGTLSSQALGGEPVGAMVPPIIALLWESFNVSMLSGVIDRLASGAPRDFFLVERLQLADSNVYPVEQDWWGGMAGTYMFQAPFSQALTVAAAAFLVLYVRRR